MFQKKEINTLVLPIGKYWLIIFCVIVISLSLAALFIFFGLKHHISLWVMLTGLLIAAIAPALFVRLKINLIAKKAVIYFADGFIQITAPDTMNERFAYSDIQYFSVTKYGVDKASTINFILRSGTKRRYIFFRQFDNDENVLNNVLHCFSSYNNGKVKEEKIQISPSFFLTKSGKFFLAITGLIILAGLIIQVVYKPKTIPASLLGLWAAYLQAKAIQMTDQKILNRFREENL